MPHSHFHSSDNTVQIRALRQAVPACTDFKGKTFWVDVVKHIERDTGKPFGAGTVSKKWGDLVKMGRAWGGGDAGDVEDGDEYSSGLFEDLAASDSDPGRLGSQFKKDHGGDDDSLGGGAGQFAPGNVPVAWPQAY